MLEINGLTVAYGERLALRNFSLSMQEGEIVLTVELRHKETGVIMKGERRTIPLVRVRDMRRK